MKLKATKIKINNQLVSQLKDENFPCLMSIDIAFQVDEKKDLSLPQRPFISRVI